MNKGILGLLAMASIADIMGNPTGERRYTETELPPLFIGDKPPTGSKEYWFDAYGNYSSERMEKERIVFKCFAINDKNAKRKYNNWKNYESSK